jgi:hypothetical protein
MFQVVKRLKTRRECVWKSSRPRDGRERDSGETEWVNSGMQCEIKISGERVEKARRKSRAA